MLRRSVCRLLAAVCLLAAAACCVVFCRAPYDAVLTSLLAILCLLCAACCCSGYCCSSACALVAPGVPVACTSSRVSSFMPRVPNGRLQAGVYQQPGYPPAAYPAQPMPYGYQANAFPQPYPGGQPYAQGFPQPGGQGFPQPGGQGFAPAPSYGGVAPGYGVTIESGQAYQSAPWAGGQGFAGQVSSVLLPHRACCCQWCRRESLRVWCDGHDS